MTPYLSRKIKVLSAVAILMVIYIHMYYTEGEGMCGMRMLTGLVGSGMCSVAVPLFYIISGYLFFLNVPDGLRSIFNKMRKRCRTLLVPYIIANLLTFLFYVTLNLIALQIPAVCGVVNFEIFDTIVDGGLWGTLNLVLISPPIAFQLWFVRDLMIIVLFSPVIWIGLKRLIDFRHCNVIAIVLFFILFLAGYYWGYFTTLAWFAVGGYLALTGLNVEWRSTPFICIALTMGYLLFSVLNGLCDLPSYVTRMIPLVGIPAIWSAYDFIGMRIARYSWVDWMAQYTFFVYLVHEPFLNIFKKLPLLVNRSEPMLVMCYVTIPVAFYVIACGGGSLARKYMPRAYSVFTGGR